MFLRTAKLANDIPRCIECEQLHHECHRSRVRSRAGPLPHELNFYYEHGSESKLDDESIFKRRNQCESGVSDMAKCVTRASRLRNFTSGLVLVALVALSSCTASPAEVVYFGADYPEYESLEEMVAAADSVAIVEFTGKSRVITIGVEAPANPDNPIENPSLGAPKNVNPPAPEPPPIVATAWEAVVVSRVAGRELPLTVSVQELGGTLDGVRYIAEHPGAPSISEGEALASCFHDGGWTVVA